jgi:hypothetical protein
MRWLRPAAVRHAALLLGKFASRSCRTPAPHAPPAARPQFSPPGTRLTPSR